jgi:D-tyrosyl-tRNA(Tyr) deacylase
VRVLLQRVSRASVSVEGQVVGSIGPGLVALVGVAKGDSAKDAQYLAEKVVGLRIFSDSEGKFNLSVQDVRGSVLAVSQFTLLADSRKGRRPSFTEAAAPAEAQALFEFLVSAVAKTGLTVQTGRFQTHMLVEILNDGPVTILLDSRDKFSPSPD